MISLIPLCKNRSNAQHSQTTQCILKDELEECLRQMPQNDNRGDLWRMGGAVEMGAPAGQAVRWDFSLTYDVNLKKISSYLCIAHVIRSQFLKRSFSSVHSAGIRLGEKCIVSQIKEW